jgi:hypothetical protein
MVSGRTALEKLERRLDISDEAIDERARSLFHVEVRIALKEIKVRNRIDMGNGLSRTLEVSGLASAAILSRVASGGAGRACRLRRRRWTVHKVQAARRGGRPFWKPRPADRRRKASLCRRAR